MKDEKAGEARLLIETFKYSGEQIPGKTLFFPKKELDFQSKREYNCTVYMVFMGNFE